MNLSQFYHARVTESKNKSIHFVLKKKSAVDSFKIKKTKLFENIDVISKSIYNYFCLRLIFTSYNYFTYFCVRQDGNYHFHFLIYKKDFF